MKMTLQGTNLNLTDETKDYIEKKLSGLDKYIQEGTFADMNVEVELTTSGQQSGDIYRAEINIKLPGKLVRSEVQADRLNKSITLVRDEVQRELKKYKDTQLTKQLKGQRKLKELKNYSPLAFGREEASGARDQELGE